MKEEKIMKNPDITVKVNGIPVTAENTPKDGKEKTEKRLALYGKLTEKNKK